MNFIDSFTRLFQPEPFRALARNARWLIRQGKIDAFDFLISYLGQTSALRLTLDSQARALADPVSRQAIHARFNPAAVVFFKGAFEHVLAEALACPPDAPMVRHWGHVWTYDIAGTSSLPLPPTDHKPSPAVPSFSPGRMHERFRGQPASGWGPQG